VRRRGLEEEVVLVVARGQLEDLEVSRDDFFFTAPVPLAGAALGALVALSAAAAAVPRPLDHLPAQLEPEVVGGDLLPPLPGGLVRVSLDRRYGRDADGLRPAAAARGRGRGRGRRGEGGLDAREQLAELLPGPGEAVLLLPEMFFLCVFVVVVVLSQRGELV
jgi:hypothetical protein